MITSGSTGRLVTGLQASCSGILVARGPQQGSSITVLVSVPSQIFLSRIQASWILMILVPSFSRSTGEARINPSRAGGKGFINFCLGSVYLLYFALSVGQF